MGKFKVGLHGINAIAMFILVIAAWRFHSLINKIIDLASSRLGIVNPILVDVVSFGLLILLVVIFFMLAGLSLAKIWKELFG